ncbi:hypothetical protein BKA70DRAFT_1121889 [Coprinopsis sp. MPI-PUGE-AT-0042]|nr:hypothetical protein BKA70DRAFT_1121889 [Coprinopsis sp. MPI-PUGE-AT-0042]
MTHATHLQSDNPFLLFIPLVNTFVDEFLRLEIPFAHGQSPSCASCSQSVCNENCAGYRCDTCFSGALLCVSCVVEAHRHLPLHHVQKWSSGCMQTVLLKDLGVRLQLGHGSDPCPHPRRSAEDHFVIVHSSGITSLCLDYCGCATGPSQVVQLLRHRLFPATDGDPQTAATFEVLENFQMLSFTSKISALDFMTALRRRTDNTGTVLVPDRYRSFLRIMQVWRHIRLMKRSGRGYEPGAAETPGSCAVVCPACPIPGINLPQDWKDAPTNHRFLYRLFLAIDANFQLCRKDVLNEEHNPGLNQGHAFIVEEKQFKEHLRTFDTRIEEDKSTCNNHDAIKSASIRGGKGTAASGVGIAQCSRHDMQRPEGAGDLQKGERYVNMDYFFADRCLVYPPHLDPFWRRIRFFYYVPKFHLPAHVAACHTSFSLNYASGVGRTDGEAPERGWANTNELAYSTREMGPGSRRDTLDDNFGDSNWSKIVRMAQTLLSGGEEAIAKRADQVEAFLAFSQGLPPESVAKWTQEVQAWERDPSQRNPFVSKSKILTQNAVRLRLADEDANAIKDGSLIQAHADVTPSIFIRQGIELEDAQRRLALDTKGLGAHSTDLNRSKVAERGNSIKRRIEAWFTLQMLFMPSVTALWIAKSQEMDGPALSTATTLLCLPSAVCSQVTIDSRFLLLNISYLINRLDCHVTFGLDSSRTFYEAMQYSTAFVIRSSF